MIPTAVTSQSKASRTREAATRWARYGTVVRPTMVASSNAIEAKINVAQRLPDSRETVENIAAPKASANPAIASRKRTHTSGICNFNQRGSRSSAEDTCAGEIGRAHV